MRAFHVIGVNLQLRLGVNGGGVGKEQVLIGLLGIGLLRFLLDQDAAVEDAFGAVIQNAIVILVAVAIRAGMLNEHVMIGELIILGQIQAIQNTLNALARQDGVDVVARELCTGRD